MEQQEPEQRETSEEKSEWYDKEYLMEQQKKEKDRDEWEEKVQAVEASFALQQALIKMHVKNGCDRKATLVQLCLMMRSLGLEFNLKEAMEEEMKERDRIAKEVDEVLASMDQREKEK